MFLCNAGISQHSRSVFREAAATCLPQCLFLEAHNMADMCFVIVSTTSNLVPFTEHFTPYITPKRTKTLCINDMCMIWTAFHKQSIIL